MGFGLLAYANAVDRNRPLCPCVVPSVRGDPQYRIGRLPYPTWRLASSRPYSERLLLGAPDFSPHRSGLPGYRCYFIATVASVGGLHCLFV